MKTVLIIEDSPIDAGIVKALLSKEDVGVEISNTGEEGIRKAVLLKPDLIILDLMLPGIDGFEVCSRLKKEKSLANTIVVVLSIKQELKDITKAFNVGADDYVIKPPTPEFLVKKIHLYLGIRKTNEQ